jgi:hypothetical protein
MPANPRRRTRDLGSSSQPAGTRAPAPESTARWQDRLALHRKEGLSEKVLKVVPEEFLYFALVNIACSQLSYGNKAILYVPEERHRANGKSLDDPLHIPR